MEQADLPGMEDRKIAELQTQARKMLALGTAKKKLAQKEKDAGEILVKIMRRHKRDTYRYKGLLVILTEGADKVTVREVKENQEREDEQDKESNQKPVTIRRVN